MAFHIPFEQRRAQVNPGQPIYIGFEAPPRPRKPRNWTGVFGFLLSLMSLVTAGFLSPIALIVCLFGLRKRPRKLATAGTVISLFGCLMAASVVGSAAYMESRHHQHRVAAEFARQNRHRSTETTKTLKSALTEMQGYLDEHSGYFPDEITGNMLTIKYQDAWGKEMRFETEQQIGLIRSAGADSQFDTSDDIIGKLEGKTEVLDAIPTN